MGVQLANVCTCADRAGAAQQAGFAVTESLSSVSRNPQAPITDSETLSNIARACSYFQFPMVVGKAGRNTGSPCLMLSTLQQDVFRSSWAGTLGKKVSRFQVPRMEKKAGWN